MQPNFVTDQGTKFCTRCNAYRPISEFHNCNRMYSLYNSNCKNCVLTYNRSYYTNVVKRGYMTDERKAIKYILRSARKHAKRAGVPFNLTADAITPVYTCPVLGIPIKPMNEAGKEYSWSIDKIVPEKGYVKGNVSIISGKANRMKQDSSIFDLEAIIKYMKEYSH